MVVEECRTSTFETAGALTTGKVWHNTPAWCAVANLFLQNAFTLTALIAVSYVFARLFRVREYQGLEEVEWLKETSAWSFWSHKIEATGYQRVMWDSNVPFEISLSHADLDAIQAICLSTLSPDGNLVALWADRPTHTSQLLVLPLLKRRKSTWEVTRSRGNLSELSVFRLSVFRSIAKTKGTRTLVFCDGQTRVYSTWMIVPPSFILLVEAEPMNALEQILYFAEVQAQR